MALHCASCGTALTDAPSRSNGRSRCARCRGARTEGKSLRTLGIALACTVGFVVVAALAGGLAVCLSLSGPEQSVAKETLASEPPARETTPSPTVHQPPAPKDIPKETPKESPKKAGGRLPTVTFLNSVGEGRRFCIIADNSNSMRGPKLTHCKQEVLKTLHGLPDDTQFYVIFFNAHSEPMPFGSWLDGGSENVQKIEPWVKDLGTVLGTKPVPAFKKALQLQPKPDVIFFLTDGLMAHNTPEQVAALNRQEPKVVINTILFTRERARPAAMAKLGDAERQLRKIAEDSGGKYTHYSAAK